MSAILTYVFRGLSLQASVGLLAKEKASPQRILIDLEYDCRDAPAPDDRIAAFLDYDSVRREVAAIAAKGHFNLLETLCREILAGILAHPEVTRARVEVQKPDIYADVDAVGVRMEATKS